MEKTDVAFVVLTYRNYTDLEEFIKSLNKVDFRFKVVVVDAYFDDECSKQIIEVTKKYHFDYIQIPNKGYSFGNNKGIEYVINHYDFEYIVVSNPDTCVEKFEYEMISGIKEAVIGGSIHNLNNKLQNPMYYKKVLFAQQCIYRGLKRNNKTLFYTGIVINKYINKIIGVFNRRNKVFQLHGSFVIFPKAVITKLGKVYDENMFLFAEESYLALKLEELGIESIYNKNISILHKQDGSMKFRNDINEQLKVANIYVFEKYYRFN